MERPDEMYPQDQMYPQVVTHALTATLIGADGALPLDVELQYDPRSPYAVTAWFAGEDSPVGWTFGRDLLRHGLHEPVGSGDVHIRPDLDEHGRAAVRIELYAPQGVAVLLASALDVYRFVMGTVATVRPGTESYHLDIDSAIDAVLVSAADD
jgi:hypothetical protein